ncbi:hypothetical protein RI845_12095 [Thalassotalea nanhaiensis]|uniref:Uncharacterized protein n=1 Tax=Thalassotalea nanhaiensis TaxID=3065648 RepID=A0ABY9TEN7_9GAMM|nr:hypothetical protein RI845_12095 [Colwelliaceae bacterium SQ345]
MKIVAKGISIGLLLLLSYNAVATSIMNVEPCTYKHIRNSTESPPYTSLMTCKLAQHKISFKLTTPTLTPLKNCSLIEERIEPLSKYTSYAPAVNGICPNHRSGLYVPMIYGSEIFDDDFVFNQILELKSDLEKSGAFARDRIDIPFYKFWFCDECDEFFAALNKSDSIIIRSINMNYPDKNVASVAIKIGDNRWRLTLHQIENEFFVKQLHRTH